MPKYEFHCGACAQVFDARRPVEERDTASCPSCGGAARRQFRPDAIFVQTPAHLAHVRADFQPRSTATHTSDYLEQQVLEDHVNGMHAAREAQKTPEPFDRFFARTNPDIDTTRPLTRQESLEVKQALGAI